MFRYDTPSVGFATLSELALSMNGNVDAVVPSATIGSVAAAVSATSSSDKHSSSGSNGALRSSSTLATWGIIVAAIFYLS